MLRPCNSFDPDGISNDDASFQWTTYQEFEGVLPNWKYPDRVRVVTSPTGEDWRTFWTTDWECRVWYKVTGNRFTDMLTSQYASWRMLDKLHISKNS